MTLHCATRIKCPTCFAEAGLPCFVAGTGEVMKTCHKDRVTDYANRVRYENSVWQVRDDSLLDRGLAEGDQLSGFPHWYDKKKIVVEQVYVKGAEKFTGLVDSDHLYWVRWDDSYTMPPF